MAVAKLAGVGGTLAGVVNPSPGSYYPTSGVAAAGQFANTAQFTGANNAAAGLLGGQFGGGPMAPPSQVTLQAIRTAAPKAPYPGISNAAPVRTPYPQVFGSVSGTKSASYPGISNAGSVRTPYPGIANAGSVRTPYPQAFGSAINNTPYPGIANAGSVRAPYPQAFGSAINDSPYPGLNARENGPYRAAYPAYRTSLSAYQDYKNYNGSTWAQQAAGMAGPLAQSNGTWIQQGAGMAGPGNTQAGSTWMQKAAAMGQDVAARQARAGYSGGATGKTAGGTTSDKQGVRGLHRRTFAGYGQPQTVAENMFADVVGQTDSSGYGGGGYGSNYGTDYGYGGYGNTGYSSATDPQSAWYGNSAAYTLNWRVATG